jgi:hypothetical protein
MATDCNLCHLTGDNQNPYTYQSDGTAANPGLGCIGCHGRDYGGSIGNSGAGLRMHHTTAGESLCAGCHFDDPDPLPEDVLPVYYGTVDTNADDPCNVAPDFLENWSLLDTEGLDNDGDGLYDGDDPDCGGPPPCPADVNGDLVVDVLDLLAVIAAWGGSGGPEDINLDGTVDVLDLLAVIGAWGPC